MIKIDVLYYVSLVSILLNFAFLLLYLKFKKTKKTLKDSYDTTELIKDLLQGEALIKITRIAPNDVFLRSPRNRG